MTETLYLSPVLKNHKKLWANQIRPQFFVTKQRSANRLNLMTNYKVILLDLVSPSGLFGKAPSPEAAEAIGESVNQMSGEGWELVAVVPATNDGSPAQIRQAYHYFRKTH